MEMRTMGLLSLAFRNPPSAFDIRRIAIQNTRSRGTRIKHRKPVVLHADVRARQQAKRKRKRQLQRQARRITRLHRK